MSVDRQTITQFFWPSFGPDFWKSIGLQTIGQKVLSEGRFGPFSVQQRVRQPRRILRASSHIGSSTKTQTTLIIKNRWKLQFRSLNPTRVNATERNNCSFDANEVSTIKAHVFTHNVELAVLSTFAFSSLAGLATDVRYTLQRHNLFNALFHVFSPTSGMPKPQI